MLCTVSLYICVRIVNRSRAVAMAAPPKQTNQLCVRQSLYYRSMPLEVRHRDTLVVTGSKLERLAALVPCRNHVPSSVPDRPQMSLRPSQAHNGSPCHSTREPPLLGATQAAGSESRMPVAAFKKDNPTSWCGAPI
ncbi:hypothetical protein NDU88_004524 [Pleurodeles waltl]|uniref:Uncharacterized protein n=1 Tax=Pleurodeles waltl TaxID=8319 RepID=A0AAV7NLB0_PLEWA|nr:hypothetical protein NDU88_004524 [Pleurodeles waltl]